MSLQTATFRGGLLFVFELNSDNIWLRGPLVNLYRFAVRIGAEPRMRGSAPPTGGGLQVFLDQLGELVEKVCGIMLPGARLGVVIATLRSSCPCDASFDFAGV